MESHKAAYLALSLAVMVALSCAPAHRVRLLHEEAPAATIALPAQDLPRLPVTAREELRRDTVMVKGLSGEDVFLMRAVRDDDGEMVAADVLDAAVVTARFRNVAERRGRIDISFEIAVPQSMTSRGWQLRFTPDMHILGDTTRLESVLVTGKDYRRSQLRGYQQYERFIRSLVTDTTRFVDTAMLERFLRRNIPSIYAYRTDSTIVSDEQFLSRFGVSEREAVDHYTMGMLVRRNRRRAASAQQRFERYVRVPLQKDGVRLDTVLVSDGEFRYVYTQSVATRPGIRRIDIVLSGGVYESNRRIYTMPASEPLTFYVSSLSGLSDRSEKYLTRVIERRAEESSSYHIAFPKGGSDIQEGLGDNASEMSRIRSRLAALMDDTVYDLDSVVVGASSSPEGSMALNTGLSRRRSASVADHFRRYMRSYADSVAREGGFMVDSSGRTSSRTVRPVRLLTRPTPENWDALDRLVASDSVLTGSDRDEYLTLREIPDPDRREASLRKCSWFPYMRDVLYPRVRTVTLDFHMHRRGMVKDTVHTTEPDTRYMEGVRLMDDRDYAGALEILAPYADYNAAVCMAALERNLSALSILEGLPRTARVNYLLALCYSREGRIQEALQCYTLCCSQDATFVSRGNLDPEISALIREYGLNSDDMEDMP